MKISKIAEIEKGQDGAIWGKYMFRFDTKGKCFVYDVTSFEKTDEFYLDRFDEIMPHSNSVMFGCEYFCDGDEFPLLYTNIYNNYANSENKLKGVTCVYRIQKNGKNYSSTLVQLIEIGFTENADYWKSYGDKDDVRPYGNFAIDRKNGIYYAFTMRDESHSTRYFSFDLPKLNSGKTDEKYKVEKVVLNIGDIKEYFDCEYHRFVQGASFKEGKIYSLEGFTNSKDAPPALRIIDVSGKESGVYIPFSDFGFTIEPEMIDFYGDVCYYGDAEGNLYVIEF